MGRAVVVDEARPLPNGWDSSAKTNRYLIDPRLLAKIEAEPVRTAAGGVVGFFHSHAERARMALAFRFDDGVAVPQQLLGSCAFEDGKAGRLAQLAANGRLKVVY